MSSNEDPLVESYWLRHYPRERGKGALILNYTVEYPRKGDNYSKRLIDGVILPNEPWGKLKCRDFPRSELRGKEIVIIQAKAHRLGMCLMGQAVFSPNLFRRHGAIPVKNVAICGTNDESLKPLLPQVKPYLKNLYYEVEVEPDPQKGISPERDNSTYDENRIRLYFESEVKTNSKGAIVWRYPLTDVYSAHAVILPDEGDGHTEYRGVKVPLKGKRVIIAHTTPNRLGMYVMGQAIFSAELLRSEAADLCSAILCRANDEILYPMLNGFPHIKVAPSDDDDSDDPC